MAKEKQPDTWGNQRASKFNQRALERQRKKRMQFLNDENARLAELVKTYQNEKLDLEDAIVHLISAKGELQDELTIEHAEVLTLRRELKAAHKVLDEQITAVEDEEPQKLLEYHPERNNDNNGESASPDETTLTDSVDS